MPHVFIKELRRRHPNVLFLSYVNNILFVARDLDEVQHVWASVEDIGRILGFDG
jgi:hypothetical protein